MKKSRFSTSISHQSTTAHQTTSDIGRRKNLRCSHRQWQIRLLQQSAANLDRLQRFQDVGLLARVVAQAPCSVSLTDLRRDFHWVPIRQRIVYKQCLMTYKAVHIGQPNYLNELIQPCQPVRTLRSSTSALLVIPFVRFDFASGGFSVSSHPLEQSPQDVRSCANQATFKSRLKSHLFSRIYRLVTPCVCALILFKIPGAI